MALFDFTDYDEEKKRKKPSQLAAKQEQLKKTANFDFTDADEKIGKRTPKQEIKPIEQPKKDEKKPNQLIQKGIEFGRNTKEFIFGKTETQILDETGKPKVKPSQINMSEDDYIKTVGSVQQFRQEAVQQLELAKREKEDFYKSTPVYKRLSRIIPGDKKQQEFDLDMKVKALERAVKDYDEFLGTESTHRGFLAQAWSKIKDPVNTFTPFLSDMSTTYNSVKGLKVLKKYEEGEELDETEKSLLQSMRANYYNEFVTSGYGDMAADIAVGVPKFGLEMLLTGGIAGAGKKAGLVAVEEATAKAMSKRMVASAVQLAKQGSLAVPTISAKTANYMLPTVDFEKETGKDILTQLKPGDAPLKAGVKGYLGTIVDYVTEGVGDWIDEGSTFVKKAFVAKWLKNKAIKEPGAIIKALKTMHFNSLVGEVLEEETGEPINALIEERDYYNPFTTPEGRERLLVETLGIGAFAGMANVSDATFRKIRNNRAKNGPDTIDIPTKPDSEETKKAQELPIEPLPDVIAQEFTKENLDAGLAQVQGKTEKVEEIKQPEEVKQAEQVQEQVQLPTATIKKGDQISFVDSSGKKQVGSVSGEVVNGSVEVTVDKVVTDTGRVAVKEVTTYPVDQLEAVLQENKEVEKKKVLPSSKAKEEATKEKPIVNKFYTHINVKGGTEFKEAPKAVAVDIMKGVETFVFRDGPKEPGKKNNWNVSEGRSGMQVGSGATKEEAIANAKERMERAGEQKTKELIENAVEKVGKSPRYKEQEIDQSAKIESDEKRTDQDNGRGDRQGEPTGTVRLGKKESTDTQGDTTKPSEQVAPGVNIIRDGSPGERPGTRITAKEQVSVNQQIENLLEEKGTNPDDYTDEDKALLRMYTGSGGLGNAGADGRGLLDEYYTPKPIVDAMWRRIGPWMRGQGIDPLILEPSIGIGRFVEDVKDKTKVAGFEINPISAKISHILHPGATIHNDSFETLFMDSRGNKKTPAAKVDLVIGNPPYGEHRGKFLGLGEESKIKKYEEYFVKRGLDLLNDNGMLTYVMPSNWLRSGESYAKQEIAKIGTLIKAYRLPNGVFGTTDIGTDIIFIQKIPAGTFGDNNFIFNHYFENHPENILGKITQVKGRYGMQEGVEGTLEEAIAMMDPSVDTTPEVAVAPVESVEQQEAVIENLKENLQTVEAEVKDSNDEKKVVTPRVQTPKAVVDKANEKAVYEPKKKDKTVNIGKPLSVEDQAVWDNVTATGELSDEYVQTLPAPRILDSTTLSVMTDNGRMRYYPNFIYYSGDIYSKLDQLESDKSSMSQEQYDRQKKGLQAILPEAKKLSQINLQPINDFVRDIVIEEESRYGKGTLKNLFQEWMYALPHEAFGESSSWEVNGYLQGSIVNTGDQLRNVQVRKRRRQVGNSLFKRFLADQLTEAQQKKVEDSFNRTFNAYYRPDYRQVPLSAKVNSKFKGRNLDVKDIQREGAAFLAMKGTGLLGYDVGVGKTLTSILAINEVLKKGWAKKPLVVVPNGVYLNWVKEISDLIPGVKINLLANLGGKFKGNLKTLQVEEGSISVITYDGLTKLGFKDETYEELTKELQDVMRSQGGSKRGKAKEEAAIEENIGRAMRGTTQERYFEDLGFDHVTIDEVHNFKNIFAGAKLEKGRGNEFRNIRGSSSNRGIKAYLMTQHILKNNNNRNVFLLSATPFTNNPLEIYSIISLMGKKRLEGLGLKNVNDFMSMFMEMKPSFVVKADQKVVEEDVIEKFQNLSQLQQLVTEYIDFRTGEEAGVERPNRVKRTIPIQSNELQQDYIAQAQELFTKKEAGPIVAITELQNITLSPYLSRYNEIQPNYKDFVDNSPKIKYAMEAIKQVKKDNPNVGQVIYMPRGIEQFPLLVEYLVKVTGFKRDQVGIISGGMSVDAKMSIQNDFNAGKVKILIGTEAIKEGINLQEKSTELYHLHLPWNPTDMLQVEGRIWRQGNEWKNVRIHYPLVENSVDSFIFQKLETKEKRIKNLWSYKGDNVSVGDLNFEEMKLDLITDPKVRVQAEYSFEKAKEDTKLSTLKVELAFAERKIKKVRDIEQQVKDYTEYKDDAIKENNEYRVTYYDDKLKSYKKDLTTARKDLIDQGIDLPVLEQKANTLLTDIVAQEKRVAELFEFYKEKGQKALEEKAAKPPTKTDFNALVGVIASENKTFFEKAVKAQSRTAPSGTADIGGYATLERAEDTVQNIHTVEFPELLRIVQQLTGTTPRVKAMKKALGRFYPVKEGLIKLNPKIFENPVLAAKVFAHELGHLVDFLPEKQMARGNILGRLGSLRKYMRGMFQDIKNVEIRKELIDLSQAWKPYDPDESESYRKYRESSKELYADAISVLFNDPAMLKEKAPKFWAAWFDLIDKKPEVKEEFFKTWDMLNQSEEVVFNERQKAIYEGFAKGEDIWKAKTVEKQKERSNWLHVIQTLFDDKNTPLNAKVKQAIKNGTRFEDRPNPMYEYEGLNYLDGKIKNFVADNFQPSFALVQEVTDGHKILGQILILERTILERGEFANPGGFDPRTAQKQLDMLEKSMPAEDWAKLQTAKETLRNGVKGVVALAEESGFYSPDMIEQMKANPAYATYQVIDYLDTYISSAVHKQVGTLKNVANPATSTVMKAIATMKAIEYNNAKLGAVDFLLETFKDEIEVAKSVYTGKGPRRILEPKDPEKGLVKVIRAGKLTGYYVDKALADSLNGKSSTVIQMVAKLSRKLLQTDKYRALFTGINVGFQTFNSVRDFSRAWKNMPGVGLGKMMGLYLRAIPASMRRARNIPDTLIREMEDNKAISFSYSDLKYDEDSEESQIERVLQKAGVLERTKKRGIFTPVYNVFDGIVTMGNFIESLPKVAGYIELKDKMSKDELAHITRTKLGSPDFRKGGLFTPVSNSILMFSNAIKEGIKEDFESATNPKTRASFWWKTVMVNLLPKAIMMALIAGLGGEWLKKRYEDVSDYDKTNYTIIPLGVDENGKTQYLRIPQDETGRLLGGIFYKLAKTASKGSADWGDFTDLFAFGAGQVPNVSPSITGVGAIIQYLSGQNPYDSFRGRNVIPDTEFAAGPAKSLPIFMEWLIQQQGLGIIMPNLYEAGDKSLLEKITGLPVLNNIAGRWIKSSTYGQTEALKELSANADKQAAKDVLMRREAVDKALKAYKETDMKRGDEYAAHKALVEEVYGMGPYDSDTKEKANRLIKQFDIAVVKGKNDPNANALIYAQTNAEKISILKAIKPKMELQEWKDFVNYMKNEKIIGPDVVEEARKLLKESKAPSIKPPAILSMETFRKMNIFNPPKASAKEAMTDRDGFYTGDPYRVEKSEKEGYSYFYYPSGAKSEIKNEDVDKYKKLVQDNFEWFGVGKYPTDFEDNTKLTDKEVARIAAVSPMDGKKNVKQASTLIQSALKEAGIYSKEVLAYALATTQHETANQMKPVNEGDYNDRKYGYTPGFTGRKQAEKRGYEGGPDYYGRGYIQITNKWNYKHFGNMIGVDLVGNPEKANDPEVAAKILAAFFKEKGIDKLVKEGKLKEARKQVNPGEKEKILMRTTYKRYLNAMPDYYGDERERRDKSRQ